MIDDKKIEEATRNYINKNGYFIKYDEEPCIDIEFAYKEGYKEGCKNAVNEFLKDLWHSTSEEPREFAEVLAEAKITENIKTYISFNRNDALFKNWDAYSSSANTTRWLYIEDLLPKEGDKQ